MENRSSTLGRFAKGFIYSALTGALLIGIMAGVTWIGGPAVLGISGVTALGWSALPMAGVTAMSAGLLGGVMRAMSGGHEAPQRQAQYYMSRPNDIAITAVSQNLARPQMQAALHGPQAEQEPELATEQTNFRDKVGRRPSVTEHADALLVRYGQKSGSHADRVQLSRASTPDTGITH